MRASLFLFLSGSVVACSILAPTNEFFQGGAGEVAGTSASEGGANPGVSPGVMAEGAGGTEEPYVDPCGDGEMDGFRLEPGCQPVPTDGLVFWLTAEDALRAGIADGGSIEKLPLRVPTGDPLAAGSPAPPCTLVHSSLGGRPAIRFEGRCNFDLTNVSLNAVDGVTVATATVRTRDEDPSMDSSGSGGDTEQPNGIWGSLVDFYDNDEDVGWGLSVGRHGSDDEFYLATKDDMGSFLYRTVPGFD
ncbi:MAG: hypothetical protein AAGA56_24910, partial [Myxococcota bacterium]